MAMKIISFHWYGVDGRVKTSFNEDVINKNGYITVYKIIEDISPKSAFITVGIKNTDIEKFMVINDDDKYDEENERSINFMVLAMLQLANKKGKELNK